MLVKGVVDPALVSAGSDFTVTMQADGMVLSCGSNLHGTLGVGLMGYRLAPGSVALP